MYHFDLWSSCFLQICPDELQDQQLAGISNQACILPHSPAFWLPQMSVQDEGVFVQVHQQYHMIWGQ